MKRIKLRLGDLKPNPFKNRIQDGKLDEGKIIKLRESIRQTGFWDNVVCRKIEGQYQLGYGHHRLEAAKQEFGEDYETNIAVADLSDAQMLQMMASENGTNESEDEKARVDVVTAAREFLEEYGDELCAFAVSRETANIPRGRGRSTGEQHEHGSTECIAAFLGGTYSKATVHRLFELKENLHPKILEQIRSGHTHPERAGVIGPSAGLQLAKVENKSTQKKIHDAFLERDAHPTVSHLKHIAEVAEEEGDEAAIDKAREIATDIGENRNAVAMMSINNVALKWLSFVPLTTAEKIHTQMMRRYHPDSMTGDVDKAKELNELFNRLKVEFFIK